MAKTRCKKRVFSGARWDMAGHQCGNYAQEGSEFCHLHVPKADEDHRRDALEAPAVTSTQRTAYTARIVWTPGQGPVVRPPYRDGYGFITCATAKATGDGDPYVDVRGLMRKKDGTPGLQEWEATYQAEKVLPPDVLQLLMDTLDKERAR